MASRTFRRKLFGIYRLRHIRGDFSLYRLSVLLFSFVAPLTILAFRLLVFWQNRLSVFALHNCAAGYYAAIIPRLLKYASD